MSENETNAAPMRLRAEPPRVTRLSRKMLAGIGVVVGLGIGGALIYALQTRDGSRNSEELYSTTNRQPADGLVLLPRDYTGPVLGPPLPGDLGRPIVDAQNKGQPVVPPTIATPAVDEAEQRRRAEEEAARTSRVFFQTAPGAASTAGTSAGATTPNLAGLDLTGQPSQQSRIGSLPSSTPPSIAARRHRIASRRRRRPMFFRPGPSSRPRSSQAYAPICPAR